MLEIVEHQQRVAAIEAGDELVAHGEVGALRQAERLCDLGKYKGGIGQSGQIDEPAAIVEPGRG